MKRPLVVGHLLICLISLPSVAHAQDTQHSGPSGDLEAPMPEKRPLSDNLIDPTMARSWSEGKPRWFAALTVDAGYLYMRPRGAFGWGKPHNTWVGIEANPLASSTGYGGYGGARIAVPYLEFRLGARYFATFLHTWLDPKDSYDRIDLDTTRNTKARYFTLEAEVNVSLPIGPGDFTATGSISDVRGVPGGEFVFEETLHVIVDPPLVWRARGGYLFRWGAHDQHSIGPVLDVLDVPKRDDSLTLRLGPVLRVQLSRHFDVRGSFVSTFSSPDKLGLVGGDFTELGVRYRTATE